MAVDVYQSILYESKNYRSDLKTTNSCWKEVRDG